MQQSHKVLKQYLKNSFLQALKLVQTEAQQYSSDFILILDKATASKVSTLLSHADIIEIGIFLIENLDLQRKPFPKSNAIYFISPTQESFDKVAKDFQDKKQPQYLSINLLFNGEVSQKLHEAIASNQRIIERLATFKQFELGGKMLTDKTMSLGETDCLNWNPPEQQLKSTTNIMVAALMADPRNVSFDIYYPKQNELCGKVAQRLHTTLNNLVNTKSNNKEEHELVTVLVFSRQLDLVSPLLRSWDYDPLLKDLFKGEPVRIEIGIAHKTKEPRYVTLDPLDKMYSKYCFMQYFAVGSNIQKDLEKLSSTSSMAMREKQGVGEINSTMIKQIAQYGQIKQFFKNHLDLCHAIDDCIEQKDLIRLVEIETSVATGYQQNGQEASQKTLLSSSTEYLNKLQKDSDRIRLATLMILCLELKNRDRDSLLDEIGQYNIYLRQKIQKLATRQQRLHHRKVKQQNTKSYHLRLAAQPKVCEYTTIILAHKESSGLGILRVNPLKKTAESRNSTSAEKSKSNEGQRYNTRKQGKFILIGMGGLGYNELSLLEKIISLNKRDASYLVSRTYTPGQYLELLAQSSLK